MRELGEIKEILEGKDIYSITLIVKETKESRLTADYVATRVRLI